MSTTIGELISIFYEQFMEMYGDEELAAVATVDAINGLLAQKVLKVVAEA